MRVVAVRAGNDPPLLVESSDAVDGVLRRFSPSTFTRVRICLKESLICVINKINLNVLPSQLYLSSLIAWGLMARGDEMVFQVKLDVSSDDVLAILALICSFLLAQFQSFDSLVRDNAQAFETFRLYRGHRHCCKPSTSRQNNLRLMAFERPKERRALINSFES